MDCLTYFAASLCLKKLLSALPRLPDLLVEKLLERLAGELFNRMAHGNIDNVLVLPLRSALGIHGDMLEGSDQARQCGDLSRLG